jgi:hypothetical protein
VPDPPTLDPSLAPKENPTGAAGAGGDGAANEKTGDDVLALVVATGPPPAVPDPPTLDPSLAPKENPTGAAGAGGDGAANEKVGDDVLPLVVATGPPPAVPDPPTLENEKGAGASDAPWTWVLPLGADCSTGPENENVGIVLLR